MNGETYQICKLTAGVKKALVENEAFVYIPSKYENRIEFHFLKKKSFFGYEEEIALDPVSWFEKCKIHGLIDVKMMMPTKVKDRQLLGFSNTNRASILMFYKNEEVRYWIAQWEFDSKLKAWNIIYSEHEWKDAPKGRPTFEDNTNEFIDVLEKIADFAKTIEANGFEKIFRETLEVLKTGNCDITTEFIEAVTIPDKHKPLFWAASKADVFGAMGSWNDSPPYMAHNKGLDEEYDTLSDELLTQIRLATLYAINEW